MITSLSNPRVKLIRNLQNNRRTRHKEGVFIIEGTRLIDEAIAAQARFQMAFHTNHLDDRGRGLIHGIQRAGADVYSVSDKVMSACSDTVTPQGILAILPIPKHPIPGNLNLALVLDRITDPGNLGTILRTALAAGVEAVLFTEGTVDAYSPKVVRSAMGAHFHLPMLMSSVVEIPRHLKGLELFLADMRGERSYFDVDWRTPLSLIIGSEANGVQPAVENLVDHRVRVPMPGDTESLNAAVTTAVILYEIIRQRGER
jgi:RNA methyltransferase, TrmH family